jgi:hypothetical protein
VVAYCQLFCLLLHGLISLLQFISQCNRCFFLLQKVLLFIVIWIVLQISMELFWYKIIWKGLDVGLGQNRCLALKILYLQSLIDVHF